MNGRVRKDLRLLRLCVSDFEECLIWGVRGCCGVVEKDGVVGKG